MARSEPDLLIENLMAQARSEAGPTIRPGEEGVGDSRDLVWCGTHMATSPDATI